MFFAVCDAWAQEQRKPFFFFIPAESNSEKRREEKASERERLNNRRMLSVALPISLPFIIYAWLADHTLPFLCKSIFSSLFRCVLLCFPFSTPPPSSLSSLLLNCSHTLKHKQSLCG